VADDQWLFDSASVLDVELEGPIRALVKDKQAREEMPFVLRVQNTEVPLQVRARGKSRMDVCDFPMLHLNFVNGAAGTAFDGQGRLKLVTHCRNNQAGTHNVLEEYAAYRVLNELTPVSRKVRLLRVTYVATDTRRSDHYGSRYAFAIEPESQVAARIGGELQKLAGVSLSSLNASHSALVYVFHYLIGNTDWSLVKADLDDACCHNGDLIAIDSQFYLLPYDFDLAGIVNAAYAKPDSSLRIRSVRQRLYRGFCTDVETLSSALRLVKGKQDEILGIFETLPGMTIKERGRNVDYVGKFFAEAAAEDDLIDKFTRRCKN
jgi:hypothetical protein